MANGIASKMCLSCKDWVPEEKGFFGSRGHCRLSYCKKGKRKIIKK